LSESWFRFDDDVDFTTSMPPEQRPKIDKREGSGFRVQKAAVATYASAAPEPRIPNPESRTLNPEP
jgi:hypothetical protein